MLSLVKDVRFTKTWFLNWFFILVGSSIMAAAYVFFIIPHKIVPGGVYGLSIVAHHLFDLPTGATAFVLNIPLVIWGIKVLGARFGVKTIIGQLLTSVQMDLLSYFWGNAPLSDDILLCSVFGGVGIGIGLALIFKAKATTGGSDIVAAIMTKRTGSPMGRNIIIIDAVVVLAGIVAFADPTLALYAIVTIFVTGRCVDTVMEGMAHRKMVFIIASDLEKIRETILHTIGRGGTIFKANGLFHGTERSVVLSAVSRRELAILEEHIKKVDPGAFIMVLDSKEILGEGFTPLADV